MDNNLRCKLRKAKERGVEELDEAWCEIYNNIVIDKSTIVGENERLIEENKEYFTENLILKRKIEDLEEILNDKDKLYDLYIEKWGKGFVIK